MLSISFFDCQYIAAMFASPISSMTPIDYLGNLATHSFILQNSHGAPGGPSNPQRPTHSFRDYDHEALPQTLHMALKSHKFVSNYGRQLPVRFGPKAQLVVDAHLKDAECTYVPSNEESLKCLDVSEADFSRILRQCFWFLLNNPQTGLSGKTDIYGAVGRFSQAILRRCAYIRAFQKFRIEESAEIAEDDFFPWLGPDAEADVWLYNVGILRKAPKTTFDWKKDPLVCMYGFATVELNHICK